MKLSCLGCPSFEKSCRGVLGCLFLLQVIRTNRNLPLDSNLCCIATIPFSKLNWRNKNLPNQRSFSASWWRGKRLKDVSIFRGPHDKRSVNSSRFVILLIRIRKKYSHHNFWSIKGEFPGLPIKRLFPSLAYTIYLSSN